MSKSIEGVPESITREQYLELVRAAGFDPAALVELHFARDGIYATVFSLDAEGRKTIDYQRNEVVKHVVFIEVSDDRTPPVTFAQDAEALVP